VGVLSLAAGCPAKTDADGIAARFIDAYYVEFDLDTAKTLASGAAVRRIDRDIERLGTVRDVAPVEHAKARVYYEKDAARREVRDDLVRFEFTLDVHTEAGQYPNTVVLAVARRDDAWTVIDFADGGRGLGASRGRPGAPERVGVPTSTRSPGQGMVPGKHR